MAELLAKAVDVTRKLERRLDVTGGWPEATARIDLDADPAAVVRIMGALLLRKARVHTIAVLRANESSNLHSLAVQMRPVLECAGQVVFFFHNMMIAPDLLMAPERAAEVVGNRRCCMIQLRREWGRFSNFSFRTPQRRISAYPARPSG